MLKHILFSIAFIGLLFAANADSWIQKSDFGSTARFIAVGFSIGNKGYIGTGSDSVSKRKDFWEYDPINDSWTQMADFGGTPRLAAVGFSIGSKGYIGTGSDSIPSFTKDFWEYDPSLNQWTRKADFGGSARYFATGFSIGNKGYIGTGYDGSYLKDFWEYDPAGDSWTRKKDLDGGERADAAGFSIGLKGYLGKGYIGSSFTDDFWEYDQAFDSWTKIQTFPGMRANAIRFTIGNYGYVGTGAISFTSGIYSKDLWQYNPALDEWKQMADFGGTARYSAVAFSINGRGYAGTGKTPALAGDIWEYIPDSTNDIGKLVAPSGSCDVYPNPMRDHATIILNRNMNDAQLCVYNVSGAKVEDRFISSFPTMLNMKEQAPGIYLICIRKGEIMLSRKIIIE